MAKGKVKKLTLADLNKETKKLDVVNSVSIDVNGTEYVVDIDQTFRKSKMHKVLDDLVLLFNEVPNGREELLNIVTPYTSLLIIKHFTSVEVDDDIDVALATLNALIDLEIFDKIINAMPENEVVKVYDLISDLVENMNRNIEEAEKQEEMLLTQIENPQVRDLIQ